MAKCWLVVLVIVGVVLLDGLVRAQPPDIRIALNNDSVRVALQTFRPRAGSGRHAGLEPELGIVQEGELTLEGPDGRQTLGAGDIYWFPSLTPHAAQNDGDRPAKLWVILLKRCE